MVNFLVPSFVHLISLYFLKSSPRRQGSDPFENIFLLVQREKQKNETEKDKMTKIIRDAEGARAQFFAFGADIRWKRTEYYAY